MLSQNFTLADIPSLSPASLPALYKQVIFKKFMISQKFGGMCSSLLKWKDWYEGT